MKNCMELFKKSVKRDGIKTALIFEDTEMSYRTLDLMSDKLAFELDNYQLPSNSAIGIIIKPSFEMVIAILAVLKAGYFYVPIDPKYPIDYIEHIFNVGEIELLLSDMSNGFDFVKSEHIFKIDDLQSDLNNEYTIQDDVENAYVCFTSGTNGMPKGVVVTHDNLMGYTKAFSNEFHVTSFDIVLQQAMYNFDTFIEELFPALFNGASVVICKRTDLLSVRKLINIIDKNSVTIVSVTPALLNELNKFKPGQFVRLYIGGGDVLRYNNICNLIETVDVYNTYGPTETTVCATYYKCKKNDTYRLPIGKPILGYEVYLLDENFNEVPEGEIYISGVGLSKGYINSPELTNEVFVDCPFMLEGKMYKTGDWGRRLPDGNIEFIGRIDNQIKINGYRIELEFIEACIDKHPKVNKSVIRVDQNVAGEKVLVCFYEADEVIDKLAEFCAESLPNYMVPKKIILHRSIPCLSNGKIDRVQVQTLSIEENCSKKTETSIIKGILNEVLGEDLTMDENFFIFDLGMDSIKLIRFIVELETFFDIECDDDLLTNIENLTLQDVADYVRKIKNQ